MAVQFYPNGVGGPAPGDQLDLARPLQTTGNVWYVSSLIGVNAASPAGQNREKPLATIAQAVTNAVDEDIIVFLPGHTETLTAVQNIAKKLTFVGEGTTAGKPAVSFLCNAAASSLFAVTAANVEFRNIYFPANVAANSSTKIALAGVRNRLTGCYFELSGNDAGAGVQASAQHCRVSGCTFISTATSVASQPKLALLTPAPIADLEVVDTVFSAGTVGFSNYAAVDLSAGAATSVKMIGISLLLGADVDMGSSATGYVNVQLATGGSRVRWG